MKYHGLGFLQIVDVVLKVNEKGPRGSAHLKENGCRFYDYKPLGAKVAVRKVITMMNLYLLSSIVLESITFMADVWNFSIECVPGAGSQLSHYSVRYPNGYQVSIISDDYWVRYMPNPKGVDYWWELAFWKEGEAGSDDDMKIVRYRTEEELIALCDEIRNL